MYPGYPDIREAMQVLGSHVKNLAAVSVVRPSEPIRKVVPEVSLDLSRTECSAPSRTLARQQTSFNVQLYNSLGHPHFSDETVTFSLQPTGSKVDAKAMRVRGARVSLLRVAPLPWALGLLGLV